MAKSLSDFIEIPGFPRYRISPKGEVYSTFSNRLLKPTEKSDLYGVCRTTIRAIVNGKTWRHI